LHPGRPAAYHQHLLSRLCARKTVAVPQIFPADRGIDEATDPVVARAPAPAHLIARDAGADIFAAPFAGLVGHMGIGDLAAHNADHVGLARGDDVVGVLGRADVAFGLDPDVLRNLLERL